MKAYKITLALFVVLFIFGFMFEANAILLGVLCSPIMGGYSTFMFLRGHRSWWLLVGFLGSIFGGVLFFGLLAALSSFT